MQNTPLPRSTIFGAAGQGDEPRSRPGVLHKPHGEGIPQGPGKGQGADGAGLHRGAARAHLYVAIRPLLDNSSLGEPRNLWKPRNLRAWFTSYRKFLIPYARMAQRVGIPKLYVGTELQFFGGSPLWNGLDRAVRR